MFIVLFVHSFGPFLFLVYSSLLFYTFTFTFIQSALSMQTLTHIVASSSLFYQHLRSSHQIHGRNYCCSMHKLRILDSSNACEFLLGVESLHCYHACGKLFRLTIAYVHEYSVAFWVYSRFSSPHVSWFSSFNILSDYYSIYFDIVICFRWISSYHTYIFIQHITQKIHDSNKLT